jgi:glycosyltransferase involved in cell wall biosynthesis
MSDPIRLGILSTHPIQYHAPLYRHLSARSDVDLTVFYAHRPSAEEQGIGFGVPFEWDVDLLDGYRSIFLENRRRPAEAGEFFGYDTPEIASRIRAGRFDAFIVSGWHALTYWQAMRACWSSGVPVLARGDSHLIGEPALRRTVKRLLYPRFVRRFSACLSVGQRSEDYFRFYGARVVVRAPHFVDNAFFGEGAAVHATERAALRERRGIPADAFVVLIAGKLLEIKRPLDAIHACAAIRGRGVHLLFAGDGPLRAACESEASRLGVPAYFAGFLNQRQMPSAYAAADALLVPSSSETWGLVVNEAMASGLPVVVSSAVGCCPDLVIEGRTGCSFRTGDIESLASTLSWLADDRPNAIAMGRAARAHIASYSIDAAADGFLRGARIAQEAAA